MYKKKKEIKKLVQEGKLPHHGTAYPYGDDPHKSKKRAARRGWT